MISEIDEIKKMIQQSSEEQLLQSFINTKKRIGELFTLSKNLQSNIKDSIELCEELLNKYENTKEIIDEKIYHNLENEKKNSDKEIVQYQHRINKLKENI